MILGPVSERRVPRRTRALALFRMTAAVIAVGTSVPADNAAGDDAPGEASPRRTRSRGDTFVRRRTLRPSQVDEGRASGEVACCLPLVEHLGLRRWSEAPLGAARERQPAGRAVGRGLDR